MMTVAAIFRALLAEDLAPEMATTQAEVVVVGAGIMGSWTAWHLAKRGVPTLLLEQFAFGHARGSSHGESRIIRRTYLEEYYAAMMGTAYELWERAQAEYGERVVTSTGGLNFGTAESLTPLIQACEACAVPYEVITDDAELGRRWPGVSLAAGQQAVYSPDAGVVRASTAVHMMQRLAERRGAILEDRTVVVSMRRLPSGRLALRLARAGVEGEEAETREVECAQLVLCAGAWTSHLVRRPPTTAPGHPPSDDRCMYATHACCRCAASLASRFRHVSRGRLSRTGGATRRHHARTPRPLRSRCS